jgi:hypothetical protein
MDLQKIGVKFFLEKGGDFTLRELIPVFHHWIQDNKLEGMLIDVTEYTHVKEGPGVLLIAHEGNYSLDETDGKRGFLYLQKRPGEKSSEGYLGTAFKRALQACVLLEEEPALQGKIKFDPNHLQIFVNNRLAASHGAANHESLEEDLKPFLDKLFDGAKHLLLPEKDPGKRVGFEVKIEGNASILELLSRLKSN